MDVMYTPSIARAVERLHRDFDQPLRIKQMAQELGMSVSVFHHQYMQELASIM